MRRLAVGDIHGNVRALTQCLERCHFDPAADQLILLGDIVDGYPDTPECVKLLATVPNLVFVIGNHDLWFIDFLRYGHTPPIWVDQGGKATLDSLNRYKPDLGLFDRFFNKAVPYYLTDDGKVFVHGGLDPRRPVHEQDTKTMMWDRELFKIAKAINHPLLAKMKKASLYKEVYIGHTSTERFSSIPLVADDFVYCLDQGAGCDGRLTVMDVDTKQFWQSNPAKGLYRLNSFGDKT